MGGSGTRAYAVRASEAVWEPLIPLWRGFPTVTVDATGVLLPASPYPKEVRMTWPEIAGIGIVDGRDVEWPATGTALPAVGAAAELVRRYACQAEFEPDLTDPARWNHPRVTDTMIVVSLAARSPAQAAAFAGVRDDLVGLVRRANGSRWYRLAHDLDAVTARLAHWQQEWSSVTQWWGVAAAVPTRRLDRERLDQAVRAYSLGHGLRRYGRLPGPDVRHTPHGVAEHVRLRVWSVVSDD